MLQYVAGIVDDDDLERRRHSCGTKMAQSRLAWNCPAGMLDRAQTAGKDLAKHPRDDDDREIAANVGARGCDWGAIGGVYEAMIELYPNYNLFV